MTRRVIWYVVLGALALAVLAAGVLVPVLGARYLTARTTPAYVADARAAAKTSAVDLLSVSYLTVDRDLDRVLAGSTGAFHSQFAAGRAQVRKATIDNHVRATGKVVSLGLSRAGADRVVALVAADATISNDQAPKGRAAHFRLRLTLVPVGGHWLVSDSTFVG